MTYKTITGSYPSGYALSIAYTGLNIASTAFVGGVGVDAFFATTINNFGYCAASGNQAGIYIEYGGTVTNGRNAMTSGYDGVRINNATTSIAGLVANYGVMSGVFGVSIAKNGAVFNFQGSPIQSQASGGRITGSDVGVEISGGQGTVTNHGTIEGGYAGVSIYQGQIVNGSGFYTSSLIEANFYGVIANGAATVTNFGLIHAASTGILLRFGGAVTNGSVTDTGATIQGYNGMIIGGSAARLVNFGTVSGTGATGGDQGIRLDAGGSISNGAATDTTALIRGFVGVSAGPAVTVTNYGAIEGLGGSGVYLFAGGTVTNGGGVVRSASIEGQTGIAAQNVAVTVRNFGTVVGSGHNYSGVLLGAGGVLGNGSANNNTALIEGYSGLRALAAATVINFGIIWGQGDTAGSGVGLYGGGSLTNGAVGHAGAMIEGILGVDTGSSAAVTVTNFGTISGAGGTAVNFASSTDQLVVEAGSAFAGAVNGDGGTIVLASGAGSVAFLAGDSLVVSGSMAATTFSNFATVDVASGAFFNDAGAVTISAGQTVNSAGTLTLGGTGKNGIVNAGLIETTGAGILTLQGAVTGAGTARIGGGTLFSASSFNEAVTFTGTTGVLELAKSQTYTAPIRGFSKTGGTQLDLNDIAFGGSTKATYSGTASSGTLTVTDGTHTAHLKLIGDYRTSTFAVASDGHGGTTIHDPTKTTTPPWIDPSSGHRFISALAGFGASGAGGAIHVGEASAADETLLCRPRPAMA